MFLTDSQIEQLCYGRLIYAELYDSADKNPAGNHWAVMLDSTEDIDDTFIVPVPRRTGRKGHVIWSWRPFVHLAGIEKIGMVLLEPEMKPILEMIHKHEANEAKKRSTRK